MEVNNSSADGNGVSTNEEQPLPYVREKLNEMIAGDSLDYNSWTSLISEIESASPKSAYHKVKLCGATEAVKIFERGAKAAECSVGFWVEYFKFGTSFFGDPSDVRRLFGRGISCVGKDYFSHVLWDEYLKYEFNQEGWIFLAQSYIEALKFPNKKLHFHYDNFKQFVANLEEEMEYENRWSIEVEQGSNSTGASKISKDEISLLIKDLLDSSDRLVKFKALDRYKSIGSEFYQEAHLLDEEIRSFETNIRRRYFQMIPLDEDELTNWHHYLDFIEKQEDLDWNVPEIHFFNAWFKEHVGDADGARAALLLFDAKTDSGFIESIIKRANMEKRLGNPEAASAAYDADAARDVIIRGIQNIPDCRFLLEELIRFAMIHGGASQVNIAESVITDAISPRPDKSEGLNAKYREDISSLFLEFVDLCGTVHDVRNAWNGHVQLFPNYMRIKAPYEKPTSGNHLLRPAVAGLEVDQASKTPSSTPLIKLAAQEHANNDVQLNPLLEKSSMPMDEDDNTKEKLQRPSPEVAVASKEFASQDNEQAHNSIHHSGDHVSGSVESTHNLTVRSRDDKQEPAEVTTELVQPHELTREVKQSQEFNPMSSKDYVAAKGASSSSRSPLKNLSNVNYNNSSASPKISQTVDSPQLPTGSDNERSENHQNHTLAHPNPEESFRTDEDSHPVSNMVTGASQLPLSSPPTSYPQQNMLQSNLHSSRQPAHAPNDQAMNQILQYQYQQHILQQQYLQYQQQQPVPQLQQHYMQPEFYLSQSQQQQNQRHPQLIHQQHYMQQMQQYYQQQLQQYYQQNQQPAYQMHQQGHQHAPESHELLLQQYQLYQQGYSSRQLQQGLQHNTHQHLPQTPQHHQVTPEQNLTQSLSQRQQDQDVATPDFDGEPEPSESSHLQGRSPKVTV